MFDLSKCERDENGHWKAQTKRGVPVLIFRNDAPGSQPLVGAILEEPEWSPQTWGADGSYNHAYPVVTHDR